MTPQKVRAIFKRFQKQNPKPTTELIYHSTFELLVAVILSAQALDASVNKATVELFKHANSPQKIIDLGLTNLKKYIKTIGLYNNKAKNIMAMSKILVEQHDSKVPQNGNL